jgi:hypothetical protein
LLNGRNIEVYWADFLKDECRPHDKVDASKTRLVSSCQAHYLLLSRRYTLDLTTYVQSKCVECPIALGFNPHSIQQTQLYYRLSQTCGSVIAGDFHNFDGRLPKYIGEFVVEFINWWYDDGEVNAQVRRLLFEHIYNATHVVYDKVYKVVDGNPSGNPMTTLYNSLCNIVMCAIILTEDLHLNWDEFNLTVYGDDNVITTKEEGLRVRDFAPFFVKRFDLEYTHFSKEDVDVDDTLLTIKFLGRSFYPFDSIFKAPLDLDTILQMVYYMSGDESEEMIMIDTSRSFFMELSHHPPDVFEKYTIEFLDIVAQRFPSIEPAIRNNLKCYWSYHNSIYYTICDYPL